MAKGAVSDKEFWASHGLKYYDTVWEGVGLTPEEAELAETKFQMACKLDVRFTQIGLKGIFYYANQP